MPLLRPSHPSGLLSLRLLAPTVAVLALIGACGSGGSDAATTTTEATTTSAPAGESTTTSTEATTTTTEEETTTTTEAVDAEPTSLWIIDADTYDAVRIDLETGEEIGRIPGWGGGSENDEPVQALQTIELGPDGWLWFDDCCEPAFGTSFGVDPVSPQADLAGPITEVAQLTLDGLSPRVSPDGALVATSVGDLGVSVADTATGEAVVDVATLAETLSLPAEDAIVFWNTLGWVAPRTLVVAAPFADGTLLSFVDLTDPTAPVALAEPLLVEVNLTDATLGLDGHLVALAEQDGLASAIVIDATTGTEIDRFPLVPGTIGIDGSPDGERFLLVDEAGDVLVQTADGDFETLDLGGFRAIDAAW